MATDNREIKVLVSGSSGYIAAHIVQQLLQAGYQVRGTVRSLKNENKIAPLKELGKEGENRLELVEADLLNPGCWKDAVEGCTYVMHTASPFPLTTPSNEDELIRPAVDGTLNVLKACAGKVKRVVLTSSCAAVGDHHSPDRKLTEDDWTDTSDAELNTYVKSKKLAEQAAWDYVKGLQDDEKFELAVINPCLVAGPALFKQQGTSIDIMSQLMCGKMPALPKFSMAVVDVRDVAKAHLVAMTLPEAAGHRHITASDLATLMEMSEIFKEEFAAQGYKPTTRAMPKFVISIMAVFSAQGRTLKSRWGRETPFDNSRLKSVLKIEPRPLKESLVDMGYSLIETGIVPKTKEYKGRPAK